MAVVSFSVSFSLRFWNGFDVANWPKSNADDSSLCMLVPCVATCSDLDGGDEMLTFVERLSVVGAERDDGAALSTTSASFRSRSAKRESSSTTSSTTS